MEIFRLYILGNAGWLMVLPLALNLFAEKLPAAYDPKRFDTGIPASVTLPENLFRMIVCFSPFLMPLSISSPPQKAGLGIYIAGVILYYLGWGAEIFLPKSRWSTSWMGFLAPAYTALFWLVGIGLICDRFFFASPYRSWMYLAAAVVFIGFHVTHTAMVFSREAHNNQIKSV